MRSINRAASSIWGDEARGTLLLVLSTGFVFVLGLALQLLALRSLEPAAYSTFVLALGLATIAAMGASSLQPVIALQVMSKEPGYLPLGSRALTATIGIITGGVWLALTNVLDAPTAALVALQLPLHLTVGFLSGLIQGERSFGALSLGMVVWSASRLIVASALLMLGVDGAVAFTSGLNFALVAQALVLAHRISWSSACWRVSVSSRKQLADLGGWLGSGWIIFGDAIMCRFVLSDASATRYALALTFARQAVFAASPFSTVLLAAAHGSEDDKNRLLSILFISSVLTLALGVGVGIAPGTAVALLAGSQSQSLAEPSLIRSYIVIGGLGAAGLLLLSWAGGVGRLPALQLEVVALAGIIAITLLADSARVLLLIQAVMVSVLVLLCARACLRSEPRR